MTRLNPGVSIRELDFSDTAPRLATTILGLVGVAHKGPMHTPTLITSVAELISTFGSPPDLSGAQNEKQVISIQGASGGTFTLTLDAVTSGSIAYNATTAVVQAAIEAMSNVGTGNTTVTGQTGGPWTVTFIGTLAARPINQMTANSSLTGPGAITLTVETARNGQASPGDMAMHSAIRTLRQARQLYFTRTSQYVTGTGWRAATARTRLPALTNSPIWRSGLNEVQTINVTGSPVSFSYTFYYNGTADNPLGTPVSIGPITHASSVGNVQTLVDTALGAGNCTVSGSITSLTFTFGGTLAYTNIRPFTVNGNPVFTGGTSPAVVFATSTEGRALSALVGRARSAGDWGNSISLRFLKLAGATNEVQTVSISGTPTGGTFTLTFNGQTTSSIAYNASASTVQTALQALSTIGSGNAVVSGGPGPGTAWVVTFQGTLQHTNVPAMTATSSLTGGTSPAVAVAVTTEGVSKGYNVYRLEVLGPSDSVNTAVQVLESYDRVMLVNDEATLAAYDALFLGEVVNNGIRNGPSASTYITFDSSAFPEVVSDVYNELATDSTTGTTYVLNGGDSALNTWAGTSGDGQAAYIGTEVDSAYGVTGLQVYRNVQTIPVRILAVPGVTDSAVLTELEAVAVARDDSVAIIDTPIGLTPTQAMDWHNRANSFATSGHKPNTSYAALYWPWVVSHDDYNNEDVTLPPSCFIPGVIAYNDQQGAPHTAPAGGQRGIIRTALGLESSSPSQGTQEAMYSGGNVINVILDIPQRGVTVWGQRTTQRRASATDRLNVRRMLNDLKAKLKYVAENFVFEGNIPSTWRAFIGVADPILLSVKNNGGLEDYRLVCDDTTNTADLRNRNEMRAVVSVIPAKTAEIISLDVAIFRSGANLNVNVTESGTVA
jgi:phage tail sheath protein FI